MTKLIDDKTKHKMIAWLECYPDTQSHTNGNYTDMDDVEIADEIITLIKSLPKNKDKQ